MSEGLHKINKGQILAVLASLLAGLALLVGAAAAQGGGQGLEISPPLVEISTDPNKTVSFDIRIRNITQSELIAKAESNDFVAKGEEGEPQLLLEAGAEPSPYSIKGWTQPIADVRLAPGEAKTTKVTLNVPADASPGGHYGVIRFTAVPPELEDSGVSLSASIGSLVLVRVSGDIDEKALIEEFYSAQGGERKGFFEKGPITFVERIKNEGNIHIKPHGTVRITGMFGREAGVLTVNEKGGNVLPGSVRRFEQELKKDWMFGRYTAEANIQYSGQNISSSVTFWVIPYKVIALVLGILIVLALLIRRGLRAYGKRAVRKHEQNPKN